MNILDTLPSAEGIREVVNSVIKKKNDEQERLSVIINEKYNELILNYVISIIQGMQRDGMHSAGISIDPSTAFCEEYNFSFASYHYSELTSHKRNKTFPTSETNPSPFKKIQRELFSKKGYYLLDESNTEERFYTIFLKLYTEKPTDYDKRTPAWHGLNII